MRARLRRVQVRHMTRTHIWRFWLTGWVGLAALAFANGTLRVVGYQNLVGETAARQLATNILVIAIGLYTAALHRRRPLPDTRTALAVGSAWTALTLAFEFGIGHYVFGTPWPTLLADYDLTQGRLWILVPVATLLAPALMRSISGAAGVRQCCPTEAPPLGVHGPIRRLDGPRARHVGVQPLAGGHLQAGRRREGPLTPRCFS